MRRGVRLLTGVGLVVLLALSAAGGAAVGLGTPRAVPVGSDFVVSGAGAIWNDSFPSVAWNAFANQYLVVWSDQRNDSTRREDIYGRRVAADGSRVGADFRISGPHATAEDWNPVVVWNGLANQYLVVWSDQRNDSTRGADIYGRRLASDGSRIGGDFRISGPKATADEFYPAVAWNHPANQYLVVWDDHRNEGTRKVDIYGRRVAADGSRVGADFRVSGPNAIAEDFDAAVTSNAFANQYLVVWSDGRNYATRGADIYGRRVAADGSRVGADFSISGLGATSDDWSPAVAWNPADEYLVVWSDSRNYATRYSDVFGQRLAGNGSRLSTNFIISGPGSTADDSFPAVAWNATPNQYLVVWVDYRYRPTRGTDLFACRLSADGSVVGSPFTISSPAATDDEFSPAVAWNGVANQYLIVWSDDRNYPTRGSDIYGKRWNG